MSNDRPEIVIAELRYEWRGDFTVSHGDSSAPAGSIAVPGLDGIAPEMSEESRRATFAFANGLVHGEGSAAVTDLGDRRVRSTYHPGSPMSADRRHFYFFPLPNHGRRELPGSQPVLPANMPIFLLSGQALSGQAREAPANQQRSVEPPVVARNAALKLLDPVYVLVQATDGKMVILKDSDVYFAVEAVLAGQIKSKEVAVDADRAQRLSDRIAELREAGFDVQEMLDKLQEERMS